MQTKGRLHGDYKGLLKTILYRTQIKPQSAFQTLKDYLLLASKGILFDWQEFLELYRLAGEVHDQSFSKAMFPEVAISLSSPRLSMIRKDRLKEPFYVRVQFAGTRAANDGNFTG